MPTEFKIILGTVAGILALVGYLPYLKHTWEGKTKPHIFSWFLWGLIAGIAYVAQVFTGGGFGAWATGLTSTLCLAIAFVGLMKGQRKFSIIDWIALLLAMVSIIVWIQTKNPSFAVVIITIADAIAFVPTIIKAHRLPHEETLFPYILSGLKYVISLFAFDMINVGTALFPVSVIALDGIVIWIVMSGLKKNT